MWDYTGVWHCKKLRSTLDSLFAQAIRDVEVMVINDDSPDSDELEQGITPFRERIEYTIRRPHHPRQRRSRDAKQFWCSAFENEAKRFSLLARFSNFIFDVFQ